MHLLYKQLNPVLEECAAGQGDWGSWPATQEKGNNLSITAKSDASHEALGKQKRELEAF